MLVIVAAVIPATVALITVTVTAVAAVDAIVVADVIIAADKIWFDSY